MTRGIKRTRQKVIIMHNPTKIDQNQLLLVRSPNLGSDDVIVSGTMNLSFNIKLSLMANPKRALGSNVDRVIVKKLVVKFEGNEILGIENFDMFTCYRNLCQTKLEKWNAVRQDIIHSSSCTENCMKLQINALDKNALSR